MEGHFFYMPHDGSIITTFMWLNIGGTDIWKQEFY